MKDFEKRCVAMLPGDGPAEDHPLEQLVPSKGEIQAKMERARKAQREAEEHPEQGAVLGCPAIPDMGGVSVNYDPQSATPSLYQTRMPRSVKMKIQTWEEARAEIKREKAKLREQ